MSWWQGGERKATGGKGIKGVTVTGAALLAETEESSSGGKDSWGCSFQHAVSIDGAGGGSDEGSSGPGASVLLLFQRRPEGKCPVSGQG